MGNTAVRMAFILVLAASYVAYLPAQGPKDQPSARCEFSDTYLQEGWNIPGVSGAVPRGDRMSLADRPGVFVTEMTPGKGEFPLTLIACSQDVAGRLTVRPSRVKTLALWRFDVDRRVFAYGAQYEPQTVAGRHLSGSLEYVQVIFYDPDGSGHFTVMKYENSRLFQSLQVPEWVTRKATPRK